MKWDDMSNEMKEHFLIGCCMNKTLKDWKWEEFQAWEKSYLEEYALKHHIRMIE